MAAASAVRVPAARLARSCHAMADRRCLAPSLGGVETLVTRPAVTSHAGMGPAGRARIGIAEDLIRVSCGIEDATDLVEDFARALDAT